MINFIIKRDGTKEPYDAKKINGWGEWASEELGDLVDWPTAVMHAVCSLPSEASSNDLQHSLIRYCLNQNTWSWNRMAGKLYATTHHKSVFSKDEIPSLKTVHQKLVDVGYMLPLDYSDEEYDTLDKLIDHKRDFGYAHSQIHQIRYKYALRNALTKEEYETCQFVFMRMAMALGEDQPKKRRMQDVTYWYNFFSKNKLNAPTPNYTNLGTKLKGFASCCLYKVDDTADSLAIGDHIAYKMTVLSAGLGANIDTRSLNDPVRGGLFPHRGKLWYYRATQGATQANIKNGRNGAITIFFSAYDPENNDILRLKNPMTPADMQIRGMDYAMMSNKFLGRKAAQKKNVFLFNSFTAPDLTKAFYGHSLEKFIEIYERYEADPNFKKTYVSAREIIIHLRTEARETGRAYSAHMDEINHHTPYKDPIHSSNLCVAPETMLLTDKGHFEIQSLVGQTVNVWNGEEFSETTVVKTGENQKLLMVNLSDGRRLSCTFYHKFYVQDTYHGAATEVRACELDVGQKLMKMSLPVIQGEHELHRPYTNGFFTGDGTQLVDGRAKLYLYGEKKELSGVIDTEQDLSWRRYDLRMETETRGLQSKFFVPMADYTVESRLKWLAGWLDADGCVYRNGDNEAITGCSNNLKFLEQLQHMLQTLGVNAKINLMSPASMQRLPMNDGSGESKDYYCKAAYRLLITSGDSQRLLQLGLDTRRLSIQRRETQHDDSHFAIVVSVVDSGRVSDTYCVTEPKRHMAVFNGILTGQCMEITEPTEAYHDMMDIYTNGPVGYIRFKTTEGDVKLFKADQRIDHTDGHCDAAQNLEVGDEYWQALGTNQRRTIKVASISDLKKEPEVALCSLAGIVLPNITSPEEYELVMYYALLMIDKCIHKTEHSLPHIGYTSKKRMSAAVGIMSLAHHMARKNLKYSSQEGLQEMHRVAETHMYYAIKGSLRLGRELGNAPWIHRTRWAEGWLPLDTYCKAVDELVPNVELQHDWEALRAEIKANGGIRNSSLVAYMPGESSSKASGGLNSIYPARDLSLMKTDGSNTIYWTAPEGDTLQDKYEIAWDIPIIKQIHGYAVIQKWTDMSISADLFQRLQSGDRVSSDEMLQESFAMYKYGIKTQYYTNTKTSKAVVLDRPEVNSASSVVDLSKHAVVMNDAASINDVSTKQEISKKQSKTTDEFEYNNEGGAGCDSGACSL